MQYQIRAVSIHAYISTTCSSSVCARFKLLLNSCIPFVVVILVLSVLKLIATGNSTTATHASWSPQLRTLAHTHMQLQWYTPVLISLYLFQASSVHTAACNILWYNIIVWRQTISSCYCSNTQTDACKQQQHVHGKEMYVAPLRNHFTVISAYASNWKLVAWYYHYTVYVKMHRRTACTFSENRRHLKLLMLCTITNDCLMSWDDLLVTTWLSCYTTPTISTVTATTAATITTATRCTVIGLFALVWCLHCISDITVVQCKRHVLSLLIAVASCIRLD
jgi:hypothetical protein